MHQVAARVWSEASTSKFIPDLIDRFGEDTFAEAFARIECHYFMNSGFFSPDDQLLHNVHKIRHLLCVIVQGRYGVVCPMASVWELNLAWPELELILIPDAGHSATEKGIVSALVEVTDRFAER